MRTKGFTLIEVMVSTAIFSVVMVIALGALLAMSESDRKAQTLKSVINNLNFSVDAISRAIRTGDGYACAVSGSCNRLNPSSKFSFVDSDNKNVSYCLSSDSTTCLSPSTHLCPVGGKCSVLRSYNGGQFLPLTSKEVVISNLEFFLVGESRADSLQPRVTILLSGTVQVSATQKSDFNLQTSIAQRIYDQ
jgi:prepilin-type N-terminal cleavage/methylation domain-containing protein